MSSPAAVELVVPVYNEEGVLAAGLDALLPLVAPLHSGHAEVAIGSRLAVGARVVRGARR